MEPENLNTCCSNMQQNQFLVLVNRLEVESYKKETNGLGYFGKKGFNSKFSGLKAHIANLLDHKKPKEALF